jgi:hypothetical protein
MYQPFLFVVGYDVPVEKAIYLALPDLYTSSNHDGL